MNLMSFLSSSASANLPSNEFTGRTVVVAGSWLLCVISPALFAMTYGADYLYAVMAGSGVVMVLAWLRWSLLGSQRIGDRAVVCMTGALAAGLLSMYGLLKLDWPYPPAHSELVGLTIALALFVFLPVRYVLRRARLIPNAAALMLVALALIPLSMLRAVEMSALAPITVGANPANNTLFDLPASTVNELAWWTSCLFLAELGCAFAFQRRMHGTALILGVLCACSCVALYASRYSIAAGFCIGAACGAGVMLFGVVRWHNRRPEQPLLGKASRTVVSIVGAAAILLVHPGIALSMLALAVVGPLLLSPPEPRTQGQSDIASNAKPHFWPSLAMVATHFGMALVLVGWLCGLYFLIPAAIDKATGSLMLMNLKRVGYTVSDETFARALMRDEYFWRDKLAQANESAATPEDFVRVSRYGSDQWTDAKELMYSLYARYPADYGFLASRTEDLRIWHVFPGSPAFLAGVRRGDVIRAIDGIPLGQVAASSATRTAPRSLSLDLELMEPNGAPLRVILHRTDRPASAIAAEKVIEIDGRKIGYVALWSFDYLAGFEFDNSARRLQRQGVEELLLDLSVNGGGLVDQALQVASAIGGRRTDGRPFLRLIHNGRYRHLDTTLQFVAPEWGGLSLTRVFVITSRDTCSASEAVINGLSPYLEIITIGDTTCGKPVGGWQRGYGNHIYKLIGFKVVNALGQGDYFEGLPSTCISADDFTHEIGDPNGESVKAALHYIRYGLCP